MLYYVNSDLLFFFFLHFATLLFIFFSSVFLCLLQITQRVWACVCLCLWQSARQKNSCSFAQHIHLICLFFVSLFISIIKSHLLHCTMYAQIARRVHTCEYAVLKWAAPKERRRREKNLIVRCREKKWCEFMWKWTVQVSKSQRKIRNLWLIWTIYSKRKWWQ